MKRRPIPDPEQLRGPEADLAAKLRAQYIEAVDPVLEERHLAAMTKAFRAESPRPAAGRWRRSMTTGFLASTGAKIVAAVFAALIATGTALAATGNLDVLPGAQTADDDTDDDLSEPGNEDEKADADKADGAGTAEAESGAQPAAAPTPSPTPAAAAPAQTTPTEPDNCDEADALGEENDDENDPEDGLEGIECDEQGATTAGAGSSEENQEEDVD